MIPNFSLDSIPSLALPQSACSSVLSMSPSSLSSTMADSPTTSQHSGQWSLGSSASLETARACSISSSNKRNAHQFLRSLADPELPPELALPPTKVAPLPPATRTPATYGPLAALPLDASVSPLGVSAPHAPQICQETAHAHMPAGGFAWNSIFGGIQSEPSRGYMPSLEMGSDSPFVSPETYAARAHVAREFSL